MESQPSESASKVVTTSFIVDVVDVIMNVGLAILTGSVVMLAEALQGGADLLAAGLILIGLRRSKKKPDPEHQFGHGKEIYFWTLISAVVMFTLTATLSFYFGFQRFVKPEPIEHIGFACIALVVAMSTNGYAFFLSYKRLMGKNSSKQFLSTFLESSLVETKNTLVLDLMGMSSAIIGFLSLLVYFVSGETRLDGIGAMLIGMVTAALAFGLVVGVKDFLIGKSASDDIHRKIRGAIQQVPEVKGLLDLKTMQLGPSKLLVNIDVNMREELTTEQLEQVIDLIKQKVMESVPMVGHIQVELEAPEEG
jgi:cation diffusion facilitator family transporter